MERTIQEIYLDAAVGREDAVLELLMRLQPLIIASIRKNYNRIDEMEDLIQEGRLLILDSMAEYREDYSVPFLGYIKSKLRFHYLGKNRNRSLLSLNASTGQDGEEPLDLLADSFQLEEDYIDREMSSEILEMVHQLPTRERQVILGFYYESLSIRDIAKRHGITYRTVINTKRRALERMKGKMEARHV